MTPEQAYYLQFSGEMHEDDTLVIMTDTDVDYFEYEVRAKWRKEHAELLKQAKAEHDQSH